MINSLASTSSCDRFCPFYVHVIRTLKPLVFHKFHVWYNVRIINDGIWRELYRITMLDDIHLKFKRTVGGFPYYAKQFQPSKFPNCLKLAKNFATTKSKTFI